MIIHIHRLLMKRKNLGRMTLAALVAAAFALCSPRGAYAIPSFARQTGLACASCHTVFPHLTPFGRFFKLHGYTMTSAKLIKALKVYFKNDTTMVKRVALQISHIPMVSVRIASRWNDQAGGGNLVPAGPVTAGQGFMSTPEGYGGNDALNIVAGSSLYIAGEITPNMGSFLEFGGVDDAGGSFGLGMFDLALVSNSQKLVGMDFVYGIRAEDGLGAGDPSNTVGTWGLNSTLMGLSTHNTLFDAGIAMMEGGELFGMLGNFNSGGLYASVGAYRPSVDQTMNSYLQGSLAGDGSFDGTNGAANGYLRLSYYLPPIGNNLYTEIGTFGYVGSLNMTATQLSALADPRYIDHYSDYGVDLQAQYIGGKNLVELFALFQDQKDGAFYGIDELTGFPGDGEAVSRQGLGVKADYYYDGTIGCYAKYLYQSSAQLKDINVSGGIIGASYFPWENVNLRLEEALYSRYNIGIAQYAPGAGLSARPTHTPPAASDFDVTAVKLEYLF